MRRYLPGVVQRGLKAVWSRLIEWLREWTRPDSHGLIGGAVADTTRSKAELMLENALLRQQLIVLDRQVKRPQLSWRERGIMVLMAIAATGTLMFFVLPRFMRIYETRGAALPKLTQVLVHVSQLLGNAEMMATLVTSVIGIGMGLFYWSRTTSGRRIFDGLKIHTPVIGTMFVDMVVTRSMRIMATMVNTGVRLLDSIHVIQGCVDNYYFQQLWLEVDEKIQDGYQLSEAILISERAKLISPGIIQMLRAGEKAGQLGHVCDKISIFYEKKLQASIQSVMTVIEPLMITILGVVIGTIAIALLLPVFRVSSVIAH